MNLFSLILREWIHSCFTGLELLLEIYNVIPYFFYWHSFQLHLPKHFQPLVKLLRYYCFYLSMVQFYLLLSSPILLLIYCLSNSFNFIPLNFFFSFSSLFNFWAHFPFAHIASTYKWASHHLYLPFLPIYFWVVRL